MVPVGFAVVCALPLAACDPGCPDGTYAEGGRCIRGVPTDGDSTTGNGDASVREARADRDASDDPRDAAGERGGSGGNGGPGGPGGQGGQAGQGGSGHADGGRGAPDRADDARDASVRADGGSDDAMQMGGAGPANDAGHAADAAPASAADGGVATSPSQDPAPTAPSPRIGKSLLFWGDTAVKYPFQGDALLRSERLPEATYRLTGKLSLRNPSASPLDVTCTVQLNTASNMERISLPPADESGSSSVSLLLACVGPTGPSEMLQRASLTCTCASGTACDGLSFESLGIIAKVAAPGSGTIQRPAPAND